MTTAATYQLKYADLTKTSLQQQVAEILGKVRAQLGSSRTGRLYLAEMQNLLPLADRTTAHVIDLEFVDCAGDIDLGPESYEKACSQIQFFGFAYTTDPNGNLVEKPWNALAPAVRWPTGADVRIDGIRARTQVEANELAGLYEGQANNPFPQVVVTLRGFYPWLDLYPVAYVTLTVPASSNARGLDFDHVKFYLKGISYAPGPGYLTTNLVLEMDSFGAPGITGPYPPDPPPPVSPPPPSPPPPVPPPNPPPPFPDGPETGTWRQQVYVTVHGQGVWYTPGFTGPGGAMPAWTDVSSGLGNLLIRQLQPDPYRPSQRQYVLTVEPKIYVRTTGAWSVIADSTTFVALFGGSFVNIWDIQSDVNQDGYLSALVVMDHGTGADYQYAFSGDYGATWQKHNSTPIFTMTGPGLPEGILLQGPFKGSSAQAAGQVLYVQVLRGLFMGDGHLVRSQNRGVSWAVVHDTLNFNLVVSRDAYQDVVYAWGDRQVLTDHPDPGFYRSTDQGVNFAPLYLTPEVLISNGSPYNVHAVFPGDGSKATILRFIGFQPVGGIGHTFLNKSTDAGVTWPVANDLGATGISGPGSIFGISLVHDAPADLYLLGAGIWVTSDEGATLEDKAGSGATALPPGNVDYILQCWD